MYVIEAINLTPKINRLFPVIGTEYTNTLSFRGRGKSLNDSKHYDGFVKKATGLDPSAVNVLNNPVFSGGAVNTGTRYNDREIILTLGSSSAYGLRKKISQMMGVSSKYPMSFEVTLRGPDGAHVVYTDAFIKDVEAPIFDQSTDVVLTLSCPKPYFESQAIRRRHTDTIENPDDVDSWIPKKIGNTVYFYYQPSPSALRTFLSYNTPMDVEFQFPLAAAKNIRAIHMMDIHGSSVTASVMDSESFIRSLGSSDRYVFEFKGYDKLISCPNRDQFSTAVSRGWPEIIPTNTPLVLIVEFSKNTSLSINTITSWSYKMRMVGL